MFEYFWIFWIILECFGICNKNLECFKVNLGQISKVITPAWTNDSNFFYFSQSVETFILVEPPPKYFFLN